MVRSPSSVTTVCKVSVVMKLTFVITTLSSVVMKLSSVVMKLTFEFILSTHRLFVDRSTVIFIVFFFHLV